MEMVFQAFIITVAVCAPVVVMLEGRGRLLVAYCSIAVGGGASWVSVWGSLNDVFVGGVAGSVACLGVGTQGDCGGIRWQDWLRR